MRHLFFLAACVLVLSCDTLSLQERGSAGQPCFTDGTCLAPLTCVEDVCALTGGGDNDNAQPDDQTGQSDDTTIPDDDTTTTDNDTSPDEDAATVDDYTSLDDDSAPTDNDTEDPDVDTLPENACNEGEICWHIIDTAQTSCYNLTGSVSCPQEGSQFYGQDGNYSGGGREFQNRTTSDPTLIDDNQTKLVWQKATDGTARSWSDADAYCTGLAGSNYGDRTDWRLPTRQELLSLLSFDAQSVEALIDGFYFPSTPADSFWTGTKHGYNYYYVDFSGDGMSYSDAPETLHQVRCVSSPWEYLSERPITRWVETTAGTDTVIEDTLTGLVWQMAFTYDERLWADALSYCAALNHAQKGDWRLPDINELESLITYGAEAEHVTTFPTIDEDYFWSSTTNAKDIAKAWVAEFKYGIIRPDMAKDVNSNGIRTICVRNKD
ncbi:MAG TPA: DUF1566 domain-containing protein [bacterium]|nr:DUF1566 domain-containing protein [bacterium]